MHNRWIIGTGYVGIIKCSEYKVIGCTSCQFGNIVGCGYVTNGDSTRRVHSLKVNEIVCSIRLIHPLEHNCHLFHLCVTREMFSCEICNGCKGLYCSFFSISSIM